MNTTSSLLRHPSSSASAFVSSSSSTSNTQSQNHLLSRIASKRAELENLRQLRDLSAELAAQLAALEDKLSTLRDGAQSVALVLANWDNVLRAIGMAAGMYMYFCDCVLRAALLCRSLIGVWGFASDCDDLVKVPVPTPTDQDDEVEEDGGSGTKEKTPATGQELPVPLVRIPVQHKTEDGG